MAACILLVEDDPAILRGLQMNLGLEGFRVVTARDGEEGVRFAQKHRPDVIVLDMMLPKLDGNGVIRELRVGDPDTPIVVLSAKGEEADKVLSLSLGADDYVVKPFSVAELIARIRAALRRRRRGRESFGAIAAGPVTLDVQARRILRNGQELESTAREFDLLRFLFEHPNVVYTREQLMREVWGPDHFGTVRSVDNFIARLRAKIEEDPDEPHHIETVRGVGYRFNP